MMKKILTLILGINLIIGMAVLGLFYLSETYPLDPGDNFYGIQLTAETWRVGLTARGEKQTNLAIVIAERHLADLARAENPREIDIAMVAFEDSLDRATKYVREPDKTPGTETSGSSQFNVLLSKAQLVLYAISKDYKTDSVANLRTKIDNLIVIAPPIETDKIVENDYSGPVLINAEVISFLGQEIDHQEYPLLGKHQVVDCLYCHPTGEYVNTPTECEDCHADDIAPVQNSSAQLINLQKTNLFNSAVMYPNHFEGACIECHNEESWVPTEFDHRDVFECLSCHFEDTPGSTSETYEIHKIYPQECILCHEDTESWEEVDYAHIDDDECASCHQSEAPEEHYIDKTCIQCHTDTEDWNTFVFDHEGYSDCVACHAGPSNHYLGKCNTCHGNTNSWLKYNFIHISLYDCKSCHTASKDHYTGQCSNCHSNNAWLPARFRHGSYSAYACATCHAGDAPPGHYGNACGRCHTTVSWSDILLDHSGKTACLDCHAADEPSNHYGDLCARCHNTSNWRQVTFDHTGYTDCYACHAADTPSGHYGNLCSRCHNTTRWSDYNFNHTGFTDCVGCHSAPSGHYNGQCSNCHNTSNWSDISYNHAGEGKLHRLSSITQRALARAMWQLPYQHLKLV